MKNANLFVNNKTNIIIIKNNRLIVIIINYVAFCHLFGEALLNQAQDS